MADNNGNGTGHVEKPPEMQMAEDAVMQLLPMCGHDFLHYLKVSGILIVQRQMRRVVGRQDVGSQIVHDV